MPCVPHALCAALAMVRLSRERFRPPPAPRERPQQRSNREQQDNGCCTRQVALAKEEAEGRDECCCGDDIHGPIIDELSPTASLHDFASRTAQDDPAFVSACPRFPAAGRPGGSAENYFLLTLGGAAGRVFV